MSLWDHLRSFVSISVITLNLTLWLIPLLVLGLLKVVWPSSRTSLDPVMDWIYRAAIAVDDAWLRGVMGLRWDRPQVDLGRGETVLVLSNHASWSDIFLLQSVLAREGPILKFLAKRELLFIPILGIIFWAYDFPLLRRRSKARGGTAAEEAERRRQDLEALTLACDVVRRRPAALMNFAEGTRISAEKRAKQKSPYQFLLSPRVGGFDALVDALAGNLHFVVDVTLIYPAPAHFWRFLSGGGPPIGVDVDVLPVDVVPADRSGRADWLAARWARKDALIADRTSP